MARLGYTLISNRAFADSNKRTRVYITLSFLKMNGIRLQHTDDELAHIGLSAASEKKDTRNFISGLRIIKHNCTESDPEETGVHRNIPVERLFSPEQTGTAFLLLHEELPETKEKR